MTEIRERLEEIQRLSEKWREGEVLADDIVWEIHEDATKALALLDESEPVGYAVLLHGYDDSEPPSIGRPRDKWVVEEFFYPFQRDKAEGRISDYVPEARAHVVPLYASPTPTDATLTRVEELEEMVNRLADELEEEVLHRYGPSREHPAMKRRFDRDMDRVHAARALTDQEKTDA